MKPNRYDLILLFAVVSGIYYVIDETLNNAPPRRTAETLPRVSMARKRSSLSYC